MTPFNIDADYAPWSPGLRGEIAIATSGRDNHHNIGHTQPCRITAND
jgi:hypothetical protein